MAPESPGGGRRELSEEEVARLLCTHRTDPAVLGNLLERYRGRLREIVRTYLDRRIRQRMSASDVVQEAYLEVVQRLRAYVDNPSVPFALWLRLITVQKIRQIHRQHLYTRLRDARRELSVDLDALPAAKTPVGSEEPESLDASSGEAGVSVGGKEAVRDALRRLSPHDQEILTLRYFELLTNQEAAELLGVSETAASMRHARALGRLRDILKDTLRR